LLINSLLAIELCDPEKTMLGAYNENSQYLKQVKGKGSVLLLMELHLTATEGHLVYGITQYYLPPDTSEHTPP